MKNFLKRNVVVVFVITTIWFINIDNLLAQYPINCNGNATCTLDNNGWQYKTLAFKYDACWLQIQVKYATCINGEKIIDVINVNALSPEQFPCVYPTSSYMNEIIRFLLVKNGEIFGNKDFENLTNIVIKTYSCAKWTFITPQNPLLAPYNKLESCNTICCITNYQISNKINGVYVFHNTVIADNTTQGCLPVEGCTSMCSAHFITSTDILESDFEDADDCNLSCYWRLDGNDNVTENNFLGVKNNMPLNIKTMDLQSIIFSTNNTEKMWLQANGRLSIGTNYTSDVDPDIMLSVDGKIISEEVIVKLQSNWPDYVFDKDYKLKSLSELHKYILENRKLPGVPSADDMQNIEVGKMIPIMMEKIEELTLYLLEIKKENDELKKKIEKLNKGE